MPERTVPARDEIPAAHRWDLRPLFAADEGWEALFDEVEAGIPGYDHLRGHLGESAEGLAAAIEFHLGLLRRLLAGLTDLPF